VIQSLEHFIESFQVRAMLVNCVIVATIRLPYADISPHQLPHRSPSFYIYSETQHHTILAVCFPPVY